MWGLADNSRNAYSINVVEMKKKYLDNIIKLDSSLVLRSL